MFVGLTTTNLRQRWEIRTRRPTADVVRINGAKVERRTVAGSRTVGLRGDGFVISFTMIPVREGDPFRRNLRRIGVVDLMSTVAVTDDAADMMVIEGSAPAGSAAPPLRWSDIPGAGRVLIVVSVLALTMSLGFVMSTIAVVGLVAGISSMRGGDEPMLTPADEEPEREVHVTAVQLWRVLCDDVTRLVESANFMPALVDAD